MKEGWEYSTIGDLCDKMNGLWKGKTGPFVNVGVIRNANFTKSFTLSFDNIEYLDVEAKQYKTRKLQKGDLIVEKSGGSEKQPVGRTVLFDREDGEYSFSNFTSVLRIKDRGVISPEFLYKYILFVYLRGDTRKMQKATTGIHNIEFDKFLSIPVPKLSLPEQQSIVDYLDSAFAKIDAMKANAEKALNEAQALFQASLKEMLEPKEGWEEKTIGEVCLLKSGNSDANNSKQGSLPYVKVGDMNLKGNETYITVSSTYVDRQENIKNIFPIGTLIFPKRGGAIFTNKKRLTEIEICCDLNIMGVIPNKNSILPLFLYYFFNTIDFKIFKDEGASIPQINNKNIAPIMIYLPSLFEQQSIVETLDSLKSKVDRLQANYDKISQECDTLKQAILRQVFE